MGPTHLVSKVEAFEATQWCTHFTCIHRPFKWWYIPVIAYFTGNCWTRWSHFRWECHALCLWVTHNYKQPEKCRVRNQLMWRAMGGVSLSEWRRRNQKRRRRRKRLSGHVEGEGFVCLRDSGHNFKKCRSVPSISMSKGIQWSLTGDVRTRRRGRRLLLKI